MTERKNITRLQTREWPTKVVEGMRMKSEDYSVSFVQRQSDSSGALISLPDPGF